jgi:hypothetical protein
VGIAPGGTKVAGASPLDAPAFRTVGWWRATSYSRSPVLVRRLRADVVALGAFMVD